MVATRGALGSLFAALVEAEPGTKPAERVRANLEHALMRVLKTQGTRAPARVEASLKATGLGFRCTRNGTALWEWRVDLPQQRALSVAVIGSPVVRVVSVGYRTVEAPHLTRRQQKRAALQAAFYERYLAAGKHAYGRKGRRGLPPGDRLILLVGELEADVNNGGFDQYLANKGPEVAGEAAVALERVGARRTARLLRAALAAPQESRRLDSLDLRFQKTAEDLPGLTMEFLGKRRG